MKKTLLLLAVLLTLSLSTVAPAQNPICPPNSNLCK